MPQWSLQHFVVRVWALGSAGSISWLEMSQLDTQALDLVIWQFTLVSLVVEGLFGCLIHRNLKIFHPLDLTSTEVSICNPRTLVTDSIECCFYIVDMFVLFSHPCTKLSTSYQVLGSVLHVMMVEY